MTAETTMTNSPMERPTESACGGACTQSLDIAFSMAFQPVVDLADSTVWAYEALVRGIDGAGAYHILSQVNDRNRYAFDQACRVKAIELATRLGLTTRLSINFLPNAVYQAAACIRATLAAADRCHLAQDRIMFEVTEGERVSDTAHLRDIFTEYGRQGFITAIDDFGAGYSGLNLLAEFQPDVLKLDMELTRGIDNDRARRAIVKGVLSVCHDLGIRPVAEGVETVGEAKALADLGITLMQGYLLARPGFEALPQPIIPAGLR